MNYPYIKHSSKFYGKFEVAINEKEVVPCHNLATARTILTRAKEKINET